MPCKKISDQHGTLYRVPEFKPQPQNNKSLEARAHVDVWWDRNVKQKWNEDIMIRQENGGDRADVITLTLGQTYDLLHALTALIMDK